MSTAVPGKDFDPRWVWGTDETRPRLLHTMFRVHDFDAALRFYTEGIGMKALTNRFDVPARRVSAIYLGFEDFHIGGCLELVQLWDSDQPHTHGSGFGHISIGVPDVPAMLARVVAMGAEVTQQPVSLLEGAPLVAFFKDLDGYSVELIQTRRD